MNQSITTRLAIIVSAVVLIIMVLMPFHEFLTTWMASNVGHYDALRVWKEVLILLCSPIVVYLLWQSKLRKIFRSDPIFWLIIAYILLFLVIGFWAYTTKRVNKNALADGFITDLRFPIFFIVCMVISSYSDFIRKHWQPIILLPAMLVIIFGLAQLFLPVNFLSHFGYGAKTVPAYSLVNQNGSYRRIQSTLRGANPLGVYLILIIPAFFIRLRDKFWFKIVVVVLSLVVLFYTYSRSAYLGLIVTMILMYYWLWLDLRYRRRFIIICSALTLVVVLGIIGLRYNSTAQNIFFHTSNSSKSPLSSNSQHFSALKTGIEEVYHQPLGGGPGTAGPASVHNIFPARIAENYYIQIAQEVGIFGLIIFLAINFLVMHRLWLKRDDPLAVLLLASFIGISLTNLVSHAWADDTISLIWWGLAGIALVPVILKNGTKSSKTKNATP